MLTASDQRDLRRSGLIAQTLGSLALGRLADMWEYAQQLTDVSPEPEVQLFSAELDASLALLDDGVVPSTRAVEGLRPWTSSHSVPPAMHDRAIWMSTILGRRTALRTGAAPELKLLITADSLAAAGRPSAALGLLDPMDVDAVARGVDPFFRTLAHFQRAAWRAQIGDIEGAKSELLWHEHLDVVGLPTGLPQAAEVDWAFGTLAPTTHISTILAPGWSYSALRTTSFARCMSRSALVRRAVEALLCKFEKAAPERDEERATAAG